MPDRDPDLLVVGGGAGGMAAARAGVRRKARVLLVQDGEIGGDCTFTGCVPSKALIAAARRGTAFPEAMASVEAAVRTVAATEDDAVFRREGVDVLHGRARFVAPRTVEVDGRRITAAKVVLAVGARPAVPPIPGLRELDHLTNENVFALRALPRRLAVLGGGAIGCELAQAFARLGSSVTLVEAADRVLPREEPAVAEVLSTVFAREGVDVRTGRPVERVEAVGGDGGARLHLAGGGTVEADRVLVAIGRSPSTKDLGLDVAGVDLDERGFVRTDDSMATSAEDVWAVGDCAGRLQLTHAADEMGRVAAGNALGTRLRTRRFESAWTPWCTFTDPEVARVGMTEEEAAAVGGRVAEVPLSEVDRAVAEGETDGFVRVIAAPRRVIRRLGGGRFVGATIVAPRAGEMIHEVSVAMRARAFPAQVALASHAYPTWSVAVQQAVGQLFVEVGGRRARPARRG